MLSIVSAYHQIMIIAKVYGIPVVVDVAEGFYSRSDG
jgi:dTDP-4-amino-4,6-dideoxygalactose transaminase